MNDFANNDYEKLSLAQLEQLACDLDMVEKTYFVSSGRSFQLPAYLEQEDELQAVEFNHASFEGEFLTYSTVRIGRLVGRSAVRSLCLAFRDITLLPYFDHLPEDQLLHVPAFAVFDIERMDR